jgi:hypothetical protein
MKLEEFVRLKQGGDSVMQYLAKFNHLSQYAIEQVNTDLKKKNCFMRGLNDSLQRKMATCLDLTFNMAMSTTISVEVKNSEHGKTKRFRREGGEGSSQGSEKRPRLVIRSFNPNRSFSRPSSYLFKQPVFIQQTAAPTQTTQSGAPGTHFPALPISSNSCFNCGKPRHFIKDCPYPKQNKSNFQKTSRNTSQGKGNMASNQADKGEKRTGQVYYTQVATKPEGEPVLMGTFSIANHHVVILFYSGASHTFISKAFIEKHIILTKESKKGIVIQSPGGRMYTKEIVSQIMVEMVGYKFPTNMVVIKGQYIDVILGLNWLTQNEAVINTRQRTIQLNRGLGEARLLIHVPTPVKATGRAFEAIVQEVQNILVVCEFPNVFPEDLP